MIRILHCVNKMERYGLETMLMNYYRNIDRTKVQFDFLTHRRTKGKYDDEIIKLGGKVYYAPRLMPYNILKYRKYMKQFFEEHKEYKIVHSHIDTMSFFPLREAKRNKVKYRISHSHTSKLDADLKYPIKLYCKFAINKVANIRFSCGEKAGKFLYNNLDFSIINNAIDTDKFKYDEEKRKKVREKFHINNDEFVIGHVGRFIYIKNQKFLIDIFYEYLKINPNSKLLLVGTGEDENALRDKVNQLKINDKVMFLINRSDVNELYQAMDIFIMPSLFEGVPLVAIEAQSNGLPCILSEKISHEAKLCSNVTFMSLSDKPKCWVEKIFEMGTKRNKQAVEEIKNKKYDIKEEANNLMNFYIQLSEKDGAEYEKVKEF